jgi:amidohydrolase
MFQPAEEGGFGALRMIEAGLLESPTVDAAFALHVNPLIEAGKVSIRNRSFTAASDRFRIKVLGRGGHAARPHLNVDPIVAAAQLIMALQTLVSREVDPQEPAVITIGAMEAGTTENVIPDTATIRGTVRTFSSAVRSLLERRIHEVAKGLTATMRADAEIDWRPGYPSVVNHDGGVAIVREVASALLGSSDVVEAEVALVSEDFAYLLERVPGAMFRLGVRDESWDRPRPTHTSDFALNETALPVGSAVLAAAALRFMESGLN